MNKSEAVKKGVEAMKLAETNESDKEKFLMAKDISDLLDNLIMQFNQFNQLVNDNQTKMLETRGAIGIVRSQLEGLKDDPKPTD